MRLRMALLATLLVGTPGAWAASPFADAAARLNGEWQSGEVVLRVDAKRAQASTAHDRPFEWQRFLVKEVTDSGLVFTIGTELFEAVMEADTLVLTGTNFRGERVLFRSAREVGDAAAEGAGLRGTAD